MEIPKPVVVPWGELLVMPIGDVQVGVEACDEDRLRRHVEYGLEHGAYFLGMGDYVDMASPSDRRRLRSAEFYDPVTAAIAEKAERDVETFLRLVDGTRGRWLGLLEGHHYMHFHDGSTSDTRICSALDAPFLGDTAIVTLRFKKGARVDDQRIWCFHGEGSTSSESGPLNQLLKFRSSWDADVYLIGHHHKIVGSKKPRGGDDAGTLVAPDALLACTGSFLKGYLQGSRNEGRAGGGYVEQRGLPMVTLGGIKVYMSPGAAPEVRF